MRKIFLLSLTLPLFLAGTGIDNAGLDNEGATFLILNHSETPVKKVALKDINPDLPEDWSDYRFIVLEYKTSTTQEIRLGFTTQRGYNELGIMSYVPGAWNRLVIPLNCYTQLPDPKTDLAAMWNTPRDLGWIKLGWTSGPMTRVDSVGIRIQNPIGTPEIIIRNITLTDNDPGDEYLEDSPAYDQFGQSIRMDYPEKVHSMGELRKEWASEQSTIDEYESYGYSKFGGYRAARLDGGTGFFRVAKVDGRWWFVDPEGYLFLSSGVNCVGIGKGGEVRNLDKQKELFQKVPWVVNWQKQPSFGLWNLVRRYGDNYWGPAIDMTLKRMQKWGLNTIANWSDSEMYNKNQLAFIVQLPDLGLEGGLMGLCDVYNPGYKDLIDKSVSSFVSNFRGNSWLIGYFVCNEPAWINNETRLCQLILDGEDKPIKEALKAYLETNGDSDSSRRSFVLDMFDKFLTAVSYSLMKYDPYHLNLGIRFGDPNILGEDLLNVCKHHFDVFSFNCYQLTPDRNMLDRTAKILDLPMIVGEFHFGSVDRGLGQSLWPVESQAERGVAYRYYVENAFSHPNFVGTGYFQWSDEPFVGRFDGENFNCGLIDVTDRPYKALVDAISESSRRLFEVHSGKLQPYDQKPINAN